MKRFVVFGFGFLLVFGVVGFVVAGECETNEDCLTEEFCANSICIGTIINCTDNDGGINIYEKGVVYRVFQDRLIEYEDECYNERLIENYCENDLDFAYHYCSEGCQDGACVECSNENCDAGCCVVTENNKNILAEYVVNEVECKKINLYADFSKNIPEENCMIGYCNIKMSGEILEDIVKQDCVDKGIGAEWSETFDISEEIVIGLVECTDSDGGVDIYTKGTTESEGEFITDVCSVIDGKDVVVEAVCETIGARVIEFFCLNGCEDGACIELEEQDSVAESVEEPFVGEVVELEEEMGESILLENCWDRNRNGIIDSIEDINFDGKINVFDCLVVYNDRESIKEKINGYLGEISGITSFLIGGADIEIRVESSEEKLLIYGIKISKGNITSFEKGELERPNYVIKIKDNLAEEVLLSGNPKTKIANAYWNKDIVIKPQTFGAKIKYFFVSKLNLVGKVISDLG